MSLLSKSGLVLLTALCVVAASPVAAQGAEVEEAEALPYARIYVSRPGVYKISFEELFGTEPEGYEAPTAALGVRCGGEPVPVWLEDGGDGRLGPGDWLELVGDGPRGDVSYHHEYSRFNVYTLSLRDPRPARMRAAGGPPEAAAAGAETSWRVVDHLEKDALFLRFASQDRERHELWFWARISQLESAGFNKEIVLDGLDRESGESVGLRLHLRGWSKPLNSRLRRERPDHQVEVSLNGRRIGSGEWSGQEEHLLELELPAAVAQAGANRLEIRVPERLEEGSDDPIVDVSVLNWIEVGYPRLPEIGDRQVRLEAEPGGSGVGRLVTAPGTDLVVYAGDGTRIDGAAMARSEAAAGDEHRFSLPDASAPTLFAVTRGGLAEPDAVLPDEPSYLRSADNQADYLMITHSRLRWALEPLAEHHREAGLRVRVVDVQDVYDEFNHGMLHPRAIKDFLSHAYHEWRAPAPRFVLLAGDASWDAKNEQVVEENYVATPYLPSPGSDFATTGGQPYAEATLNRRNLIPAWSYLTSQGQAAGDNWFVDVEGDDDLPDMAIGRLPVTEYQEVESIVEKTLAYVEKPEVGPWRRSILWISDGGAHQDRVTDEVAAETALAGFAALKIKPDRNAPTNDEHRQRLREAFDRGQYLVHFIGHGGRFIWRTAPADFEKNRDLFTLEDLDVLEPTRKLPIVLGMTCYSAPFDHPSSDSIGEKFLRLEGRGAVAVIASSWRISPGLAMSRALVEELTRPGTVGEAMMRAKRRANDRVATRLYNLLGDPALTLPVPAVEVELGIMDADRPVITGSLADPSFRGRATVDWLDARGGILHKGILFVDKPSFFAGFSGTEEERQKLHSVRVYLWNVEEGRDGVAMLRLADPPGEAPVESPTITQPAG